MATLNPLEAKARSSFWKGIIIAALFGILGCAALGYFLYTKIDSEKKRLGAQVPVYVLQQDVKSGEILNSSMFVKKNLDKDVVPEGASSSKTVLESCDQTDIDGNPIQQDNQGYFIHTKDEDIPIKYDKEQNIFLYNDGTPVEMGETTYIAKVDLVKNTVMTPGMVGIANEQITPDVREREYNCIVLPTDIEVNETVDIRLKLPTGEDYVVLSKKKIVAVSAGDMSTNYSKFKLGEYDTLMLNAAIVDAALLDGASVYAVKYVDPGLQSEAKRTYEPRESVLKLLIFDENIVQTSREKLANSYKDGTMAKQAGDSTYREYINSKLNQIDAEEQTEKAATEAKSQSAIQISDRAAFLGGMGD